MNFGVLDAMHQYSVLVLLRYALYMPEVSPLDS